MSPVARSSTFLGRNLTIAAVVVAGLALGLGLAAVVAGDGTRHRAAPSVQRLHVPGRAFVASDTGTRVPVVRPTSAKDAVETFYAAEVRGDDAGSYAVLDDASRGTFVSVADWIAAKPDRSQPTSFSVRGQHDAVAPAGAVDVEVDVTHVPTLDPFVGLVPGRSVEVMRAVSEDGTWRVVAEPVDVEPRYPSDASAGAVVSRWLSLLTACQPKAAATLQTSIGVIGSPYYLGRPCAAPGPWTVGGVRPATTVAAEPLVSAYGPGVGDWARLVAVHGPDTNFYAAVAPLGDAWRVIGVLADDDPTGG